MNLDSVESVDSRDAEPPTPGARTPAATPAEDTLIHHTDRGTLTGVP